MTESDLCRSDNGAGNKTQGPLSPVFCSDLQMIRPWLIMTPMVWRFAMDFHDARHDALYYPVNGILITSVSKGCDVTR